MENQISPFPTHLSGTEGLTLNTHGSHIVLTLRIRLLEDVYAVLCYFSRANVFTLFFVLSRANMFTLFYGILLALMCLHCFMVFSRANVFTLFLVPPRANVFALFYVIFLGQLCLRYSMVLSRADMFTLFLAPYNMSARICFRCYMYFYGIVCVPL